MSRLIRIATALLLAVCTAAHAQTYPSKPVRILVGFAPGGGTDIVSRVIAQRLSEVWGQPVLVENRAGATGAIAADLVAKAPADGYTLIMGHANSHAIGPHLNKLPYDPLKDFAPISYVGYVPNVLAVHPSIPAKNVKELVALLKASPDKYNYASSGNGSSQHLAGELFQLLTGVKIVHVPYKGSGDGIKDLLTGVVAMNFDTMPPVMEHIKGTRLKGLAISTSRRLPQLPDVPTFDEEGIKNFEVLNWYGVMGPGTMPRELIGKLNTDINRVMREPEIKARLEQVGTQLRETTPEEFAAFMRTELAKYGKLIQDANIKLQ